jgi:mediator of RNA polymerase II transcription subunit 17
MDDEAQYWKKAFALKEKGWTVMRMPRERHTLGVKFGFSEGLLYPLLLFSSRSKR